MSVFIQLGRTGIFPGDSRRGRGPSLLSSHLAAICAVGWHSGLFFFMPGLVHWQAAGERREKERERKIK
jgi:hypothetical protein